MVKLMISVPGGLSPGGFCGGTAGCDGTPRGARKGRGSASSSQSFLDDHGICLSAVSFKSGEEHKRPPDESLLMPPSRPSRPDPPQNGRASGREQGGQYGDTWGDA